MVFVATSDETRSWCNGHAQMDEKGLQKLASPAIGGDSAAWGSPVHPQRLEACHYQLRAKHRGGFSSWRKHDSPATDKIATVEFDDPN